MSEEAMFTQPTRKRSHVLIAGGGVAGLEALLALRALAGHQVAITLLAPETRFVYRPMTVAEAFARGQARVYPLASLVSEQDATLVRGSLQRVDCAELAAFTESGQRLAYDRLVIAVGAQGFDPLPGAITFRGRDTVAIVERLLAQLRRRDARSVAFALASEHIWPLPLYELALMTADHLRRHDTDGVAITLVTPERAPLELFGHAASRAVEGLLHARAIELRRSSTPVAVRPSSLALAVGGAVPADRVVTLPVPQGPALPGLPHDEHGFIPVDPHGRVSGVEGVFAAGDVTAFPLKQGGLAAQQADAAAQEIAAELGAAVTPQPFRPVLRGLLMTGGPPLYLRAEWPPQAQNRRASAATKSIEQVERVPAAATGQPLWWPPSKVAGPYLAPYLATAHHQPVPSQLVDRTEIDGSPVSDAEQTDALELGLLLADLDAKWGDYRSALEALDAAEAAWGELPPEYEARRRRWRRGRPS